MKVAALNALQQMDPARARPILRSSLPGAITGRCASGGRRSSLVAQQDEAGTEDILLESVRTDPDPEVRRQAVFWLSEVGTERARSGHSTSIPSLLQDPEIQDKAGLPLPAR